MTEATADAPRGLMGRAWDNLRAHNFERRMTGFRSFDRYTQVVNRVAQIRSGINPVALEITEQEAATMALQRYADEVNLPLAVLSGAMFRASVFHAHALEGWWKGKAQQDVRRPVLGMALEILFTSAYDVDRESGFYYPVLQGDDDFREIGESQYPLDLLSSFGHLMVIEPYLPLDVLDRVCEDIVEMRVRHLTANPEVWLYMNFRVEGFVEPVDYAVIAGRIGHDRLEQEIRRQQTVHLFFALYRLGAHQYGDLFARRLATADINSVEIVQVNTQGGVVVEQGYSMKNLLLRIQHYIDQDWRVPQERAVLYD